MKHMDFLCREIRENFNVEAGGEINSKALFLLVSECR
jgi:hypothetical protein